jgi:hypothetical protein
MRQWLCDFTLTRALTGQRPQWLWEWLSNVTFVSVYADDDDEIPY